MMQTQSVTNDLNRFLALKKAAEMRMNGGPSSAAKTAPATGAVRTAPAKPAENPASAFMDLIKALRGTGDNTNNVSNTRTTMALNGTRPTMTARTTNPAHMTSSVGSAGKTAKGLLSAYTTGRVAVEAVNRENSETEAAPVRAKLGKLFDAIA
jgi:hypothetical protein